MKKSFFFFGIFIYFFLMGEDKHFVVDICSYNNAEWYENNLDSVITQDYPYYRIIYTDDASLDGTGDLVEKYVARHGLEERVTLIKNKERRRALANHYNAIHLSRDNEIILTLDGDDLLAHEKVLSTLNRIYNSYDIWFAYSKFVNWPKKGNSIHGYEYSRPIQNSVIKNCSYRSTKWVCGQLRTFYAWLAKSIKLEDLILSLPRVNPSKKQGPAGVVGKMKRYELKRALETTNPLQGYFFPSACDVALMIPMLEMASGKFKYIDDALYLRNIATDLNDHKVDPCMQNYCAFYIRNLPQYRPLEFPICREECIENQNAAAVVFALDASQQELSKHISFLQGLQGITDIFVFGKKIELKNVQCFEIEKYKDVLFIILENNSYILVSQGNEQCQYNLSISNCIAHLERTYAHALFFEKPNQVVKMHQLFNSDIFFWQYAFYKPRSSMALYRKNDIMEALKDDDKSIINFWDHLSKTYNNLRSVGLFLDISGEKVLA